MTEYRRLFIPGGSYFFTVVAYQRRPIFHEPRYVDLQREAFKHVMKSKPFTIDAIVILPDHLHCIWQLPENDDDFSGRWREIKKYVSKRIGADGKRPKEKDVWQRRLLRQAQHRFGSMASGTKTIGGGMSIISITTPSSMA